MNLEKILNLVRVGVVGITLTYSPSYANAGVHRDDSVTYNMTEKRFQEHKLERILFRGVGASDKENLDIGEWKGNFDAIVNLSSGNPIYDLVKANKERKGESPTAKDFQSLDSFNVGEIYAHSWGAEAVYNAIRDKRLVPKRIVLINPPSLDLGKWVNLSNTSNIKIELLVGSKDVVKYLPHAVDAVSGVVDAKSQQRFIDNVIKNGKKNFGDRIDITVYDGGHGLKGALSFFDSRGEFDLLPSVREAKEGKLREEMRAAAEKVSKAEGKPVEEYVPEPEPTAEPSQGIICPVCGKINCPQMGNP